MMSQKDSFKKDADSLDETDEELALYLQKNDHYKKMILGTIISLWMINSAVSFMVSTYHGTAVGTLLFISGFYLWGWMDARKELKMRNTEFSFPKRLTIFVGVVLILSLTYIFWTFIFSFL